MFNKTVNLIISFLVFSLICLSTVYSNKININAKPALLIIKQYRTINKNFEIVVPYVVNLMAIDLIIKKKMKVTKTVKRYIEWYLDHLNYPDKFSLTGTIYDYKIYSDGSEESLESSDSVVAYSATFIMLLYKYAFITKDYALLKKNRKKIADIAYVIPFLQETNGLIKSIPGGNKLLLKDSCLSYTAIKSLQKLYKILKWKTNDFYSKINKKILNGIQMNFYNKENNNFYWNIEFDAGKSPVLKKFYPDAYSQLFPIISGIQINNDIVLKNLWDHIHLIHSKRSDQFIIEQKILFKWAEGYNSGEKIW